MTPAFIDGTVPVPVHGGDLHAIGRAFDVDPVGLLDFSASINPAGPPASLLHALAVAANDVAGLGRYPEPDARSLRTALAGHLDIEPDAIVVANGAAALFAPILAAVGAQRCVVPVPAFSEYRSAVWAAAAEWHGVPLAARDEFALDPARIRAAAESGRADVCLITNPHNPSGACSLPGSLQELAASLARCGTSTIVDEAFIDYAPDRSITRAAATTPHLVAVRSLTKFFGVPSLRVGYAVAMPAAARAIRARLPSWPVTSLTMDAVAAALGDAAYARTTIADNAAARMNLERDLAALGLHVVPSAANFLMLALPPQTVSATELTRRLIIDERIVVRDCTSYEGLGDSRYIRVAVRGRADNARLVRALANVLRGESTAALAADADVHA